MKIVDFVEFFVGENLKASRIVPYAPATPHSRPQLTSFANVRRQGLERRKWARKRTVSFCILRPAISYAQDDIRITKQIEIEQKQCGFTVSQ
ncbi:hypothetical protein BAE39_29505 [Mesorhizobium loti]|uniref:Uncharacterized protein n=1 Tax=Rhizobium loti TaxID=381 RepID=A0A1A5QPK1_RHILI|nr:hypothetical protein BAE39_29505 [Mesorhizobium loti]OBQ69655.1 hypothetical protein A8145_29185 [Mesorhizobium loti]